MRNIISSIGSAFNRGISQFGVGINFRNFTSYNVPKKKPQLKKKSIAAQSSKYTIEFENGDECVICLEHFKRGDDARRLDHCGHVFHVSCIDEWLTKNPTCPLCLNIITKKKPPRRLISSASAPVIIATAKKEEERIKISQSAPVGGLRKMLHTQPLYI